MGGKMKKLILTSMIAAALYSGVYAQQSEKKEVKPLEITLSQAIKEPKYFNTLIKFQAKIKEAETSYTAVNGAFIYNLKLLLSMDDEILPCYERNSVDNLVAIDSTQKLEIKLKSLKSKIFTFEGAMQKDGILQLYRINDSNGELYAAKGIESQRAQLLPREFEGTVRSVERFQDKDKNKFSLISIQTKEGLIPIVSGLADYESHINDLVKIKAKKSEISPVLYQEIEVQFIQEKK